MAATRLNKVVRLIRKNFNFVAWLLVLSSVAYFCIINWGVSLTEIRGSSMEPTYYEMDKVLVNHFTLLFRNPQKGEVVVLWKPKDGGYDIKRVAAVPGDKIQNPDGVLRPLGRDQYFVLGDNSKRSYDSRYYGPVHRIQIIGVIK